MPTRPSPRPCWTRFQAWRACPSTLRTRWTKGVTVSSMGRVLALAFLVLLALPIFAQGPDWQHVDVYQLDPALAVARLTPAEKRQISRFVSKHLQPDSDECVSMPDGPGPSFYIAPLGRPSLYVVRAGSGCGGA